MRLPVKRFHASIQVVINFRTGCGFQTTLLLRLFHPFIWPGCQLKKTKICIFFLLFYLFISNFLIQQIVCLLTEPAWLKDPPYSACDWPDAPFLFLIGWSVDRKLDGPPRSAGAAFKDAVLGNVNINSKIKIILVIKAQYGLMVYQTPIWSKNRSTIIKY